LNTIVTKTEEAKKLIRKSIMKYEDKVGVFCSFGKDSMVVLHLALQIDPKIKVISVMTPFKPKETFDYLDMIRGKWNLDLAVYGVEKVITSPGLYAIDPDECCRIYKEEPTKKALHNFDAWICGLRRTEGRTRVDFEPEERTSRDYLGEEGYITKINPILDWYEVDIWKYMAIHQIPVHPWYAMGYRSLGCWPCTHIVDDEETERAGRWQGTSKCGGECGIHTMHKR